MGGIDGGQARADHGPRQRPVAGLGHRQGSCATRAPSWPSATRAKRSRSACARSPSSSAATCWSIATSATWRRSTAPSTSCRSAGTALDFVVHAIGFSDKNELRGKFVDTSLDNFLMTMNISVYSFVAVAQRARAMMKPRRVAADAELLWRREGHPALQRHGRRQGGARDLASNISPPTSAPRASASTRSAPGRSRPWRPAASATSATS